MSGPRPSDDRKATRILVGMLAGVALGLTLRTAAGVFPGWARPTAWLAAEIFDPVGQIFLRLLFFVVVPLVFCSLALGLLQLGNLSRLGPLAARTFFLFALNMAVGVALGLAFMNLVHPGQGLDLGIREQLLAQQSGAVGTLQAKPGAAGLTQLSLRTLVEMFMPRNLLGAVADFQILPLILFSLLVGAAGTTLAQDPQKRLEAALQTVADLMTRIVDWALRLAPYAVAALLASVVVKFGASFLSSLLVFALGVIGVIALHLFGTMTLLLKLFTRRGAGEFFGAIRVVLVTAFSTSSSNATLPTSIQVARERLGVSAGTAGFVLPLGATINMSGTALYEGCVVLFVAQAYGIELGLMQQATLLVLAVLSAVAVAGIPGGSLPLIMGLLATFGIPPEGIAIVLGIDRILDMARTTLNVGADLVTACIVDDWSRPAPAVPK